MRILIYAWRDLKHSLAGGAEVYTDCVAAEWVKMGHTVTLFCAAVDGEPEREVSAGGYQVIRKGSRHGVYREARKFWKREGKGNFDLVVDEVNTRPFLCSNFASDVRVIALVFQVAREVWFYEANLFVALMGRYILERRWLRKIRNTKVFTISESSRRSLEGYGLNNVVVVPVGYESRERRIVDKELDPTLVFLGRLSANKRPGDAIKAFEIVKGKIPNAKMWVIGDGPERAKLERRAVDGVEFLGRLSECEKSKRLALAHLLIVTSVREGWGMVVTEAALLGTAAVGYNVDGLRDSLSAHGGMVVNPNPMSLAEAIIPLLFTSALASGRVGSGDGHVLPWRDVSIKLLVASAGENYTEDDHLNVVSKVDTTKGSE